MSNLRQEFSKGEIVILDQGFRNSSEVEVVIQSPGKLYTSVKCPDSGTIWDVMTNRLTKKSNEPD